MGSVNKVILLGNAGKDPEVKNFDNGKKVSLSLATTEKYKDKSGQTVETTEWHNLTFWGKLGDVVEKYVKKGNQIYVEGKIKTTKSEKDGVTKYFTDIVCNEMTMLGGAKSESINDLPF